MVIILDNAIVVGRVFDGKNMIGLKVYNLVTLQYWFINKESYNYLFSSLNILNCKYRNNKLIYTDKVIDVRLLTKYNRNGFIIQYGEYSDSELIARYLGVDPDSIFFYVCGGITSGAITDPFSKDANKHAEMYYAEIRKMSTDVFKIANNINVDVNLIIKIKNYLFLEQHLINGKLKPFDASFHIAQSWQRLMSDERNIKPHDITLIKHELYEMNLISKGMSREKAHLETSKIYNYEKESDEYYDNLKEH
jgi:hypothetical protein